MLIKWTFKKKINSILNSVFVLCIVPKCCPGLLIVHPRLSFRFSITFIEFIVSFYHGKSTFLTENWYTVHGSMDLLFGMKIF